MGDGRGRALRALSESRFRVEGERADVMRLHGQTPVTRPGHKDSAGPPPVLDFAGLPVDFRGSAETAPAWGPPHVSDQILGSHIWPQHRDWAFCQLFVSISLLTCFLIFGFPHIQSRSLD
jgi:hypothetical protein